MKNQIFKDGDFNFLELIFKRFESKFENGMTLREFRRTAALRFSFTKKEARLLLKCLKIQYPINEARGKISLNREVRV